MPALLEVRDEIKRIKDSVGASVVGVESRRGAGSGVVIGPGRVLTNAHNVWGDEIRVTFADGRIEQGKVTAADVDGDVAVVEVSTADAPALEWDDAGAAEIGDPVFALSNPAGNGLRVSVGFVSGTQRTFRGPRGRLIAGSLEHTSPLLPGSSGGPVVDVAGRLLGINTNRLGEGFYLAIPADEALRRRVDSLGRGEAPKRRKLGVGLAPSHVAHGLRRAVGLPEADGLLVRSVEDDSAAAKAGLREGDLITAANGSPVADADALHVALSGDGKLTLAILRGTDEQQVEVSF
jgi:serine protease Do